MKPDSNVPINMFVRQLADPSVPDEAVFDLLGRVLNTPSPMTIAAQCARVIPAAHLAAS